MEDEINLKKIERKAYLSYHQDGLLDVSIGVFIIGFGLYVLSDSDFPFMAILPALLVPVWAKAKKKITYPRIGYVKFRKGTSTIRTKNMLFLSVVLTLLLVTGVFVTMTIRSGSLPSWASIIGAYNMVIAGAAVAVVLSVVARINGLNRLYAYAALFFAMYTAGYFLVMIPGFDVWQRTAVMNILLGAIISGYGLYLLSRFLREYPAPDGDEFNAEK